MCRRLGEVRLWGPTDAAARIGLAKIRLNTILTFANFQEEVLHKHRLVLFLLPQIKRMWPTHGRDIGRNQDDGGDLEWRGGFQGWDRFHVPAREGVEYANRPFPWSE